MNSDYGRRLHSGTRNTCCCGRLDIELATLMVAVIDFTMWLVIAGLLWSVFSPVPVLAIFCIMLPQTALLIYAVHSRNRCIVALRLSCQIWAAICLVAVMVVLALHLSGNDYVYETLVGITDPAINQTVRTDLIEFDELVNVLHVGHWIDYELPEPSKFMQLGFPSREQFRIWFTASLILATVIQFWSILILQRCYRCFRYLQNGPKLQVDTYPMTCSPNYYVHPGTQGKQRTGLESMGAYNTFDLPPGVSSPSCYTSTPCNTEHSSATTFFTPQSKQGRSGHETSSGSGLYNPPPYQGPARI